MNIKPITLQPTTEKYVKFEMLQSTKKIIYAPRCWNIMTVGKYKNYEIKIFENYIDRRWCSTLIALNKAGKWIKSKLKHSENQQRKVTWSYADDSVLR